MSEKSVSDLKEVTVESFDLNNQLNNLRGLLEQLCNVSLTDYTFWLQSRQQLNDDKCLLDYGIEGEGVVKIEIQLKTNETGSKIIDINDVLKQTNYDIEELDDGSAGIFKEDTCVHWVEAKDFVNEKLRYNIPSNPHDWSIDDVKHWICWAVKTFELKDVKLDKWNVTGEYVCRMTADDFIERVPTDNNGNFWMHILSLQKYGQVLVKSDTLSKNKTNFDSKVSCSKKLGQMTVNLWKFLLGLLTDKEYQDIIRWVDDNGEFQLVKPDMVARLWGEKKQNNNMTYEKLCRALRYYSEENMITKVAGKRFVYKFNFNIKEIVGYSPMQLNKLLNDE